jgi:4a-hydroxytetrahydrobiopterin dehydratase
LSKVPLKIQPLLMGPSELIYQFARGFPCSRAFLKSAASARVYVERRIDMSLADKKCPPCDEGTAPLPAAEQERLRRELGEGWNIQEKHHLEKEYKFKDFVSALEFTNKIGAVAEQMGHHPDIFLTWGKVGVKIFTHKVNGLTENDFVLAAKIEKALTAK